MNRALRIHVAARQRKRKLGLHLHDASATPSCAISSDSTATSLFTALKLGPVHLQGQPLTKFQRSLSLPASSTRTIEPGCRSVLPSITFLRQSHNVWSSVIPHLSVMLEYFT